MSAPERAQPVVAGPLGWMGGALCAQVDPELFYPPPGGPNRQARQICSRCPVRRPCLAYALAHGERYGVWGGLSETARRRHGGATAGPAPGLAEVDEVVVARLIAGHPVAGATRTELAHAALGLHRGGWDAGWIAAWLGVPRSGVQRWVARDRTGAPLTPRPGPRHRRGAV